MRLKLFGRRLVSPIQRDLSPYQGQADNVFGFLSQKYGVDFRSRNRLKAYKGVVYGCVSLIGAAMTDYRPYLEQKKGKVWERVDHEFMDLLYQPGGREAGDRSDSFSATDLWEATGIYQVLQGDAYWAFNMGKTTGLPREIVILRADKVGHNIDPNTGKVTGYFIRQATGDPIPLETREVLRFPLFNPEDPYSGKSVVAAGNDYIVTDEATSEFTNAFFRNGGAISGVLSLNGDMTGQAFKKFVRAFRDKYQGVTNAGKVAILRKSDASYEKIGLGLDELDMDNLRKMSLADVAMMFGVPLELLGKVTDGAGLGRANIEALEYNFAKWNIDKKMKRFDSIISFALLRYYGLNSSEYRVCHENIIPEDKEYELNRLDKLVDRTITRNEARAKEEAPDAPGGDQLFVPAMQLPLDEVTSETAQSTAASYKPIRVKLVRQHEKKKT